MDTHAIKLSANCWGEITIIIFVITTNIGCTAAAGGGVGADCFVMHCHSLI